MSSVLSPVLGSSTNADSPSSGNSTNITPPSPPIPDSSPPPPSDSSPPPPDSSPPPPLDSSAPPPKSDPTVPAAPPPSDSKPPPAPPPSSPPPPTPTSPPPSDPPPPPNAPPPIENPPPPKVSPPPPKISPPKPSPSPPPPEHEASPPSPPAVPPSYSPPPPPVDNSPPPSEATPPTHSPPPPVLTPPPDVILAPPPSDITPPNSTAPPPNIPLSSSPPPLPPPATDSNTSKTTDLASPPAASTKTPPSLSPNNSTASPKNTGGVQAGSVAAIVSVGLLTLSLVVLVLWLVHNRKKKRNKFNLGYMKPSPFSSSQNSDSLFLRTQQSALSSANQSPYHSAQLAGSASTNDFAYGDSGGLGSSRSWFTYEELAGATNGFSENNLLGEGGFGYVYKGSLADGRVVAVKQLKSGGGQGEREFRAEVEIISRIHHRHLVSLVGYCISDAQRMLVYDYVANDTLYHHLHGKGPVMTWATRFKCAIGSARGLAYLHEDCNPKIIHRDIKSANILLDNNFEAKVADFGLARLALELEAHTHVSTRVMGTFGYMAPEYATTGKLTEKSDVFSYGVVILELITGRKPVDSTQTFGDEGLVEWARPLLAQALENERFDDVVDHRLENNFVKSEMFRLIEAAAACVRHSASKRPKMSQVVRALESVEEISDLTNGLRPGESQIFDSRQQSAQIRMFQRMAFGSQEYSLDINNSQSSWRSGL